MQSRLSLIGKQESRKWRRKFAARTKVRSNSVRMGPGGFSFRSTGRRISKGFKTKAEAQEWLRNTQTDIERGFDYQASKITLGEYLPRWLENTKAALRPKTADQYERIVHKHILPRLGKVQLKDLRLDDIERFYAELLLVRGWESGQFESCITSCTKRWIRRCGIGWSLPTRPTELSFPAIDTARCWC